MVQWQECCFKVYFVAAFRNEKWYGSESNIVGDIDMETGVAPKIVQTYDDVKSEEERKQASMKRMMELAIEQSTGPLAQDLQEGVSDSEW
jgi:hypothetical protein